MPRNAYLVILNGTRRFARCASQHDRISRLASPRRLSSFDKLVVGPWLPIDGAKIRMTVPEKGSKIRTTRSARRPLCYRLREAAAPMEYPTPRPAWQHRIDRFGQLDCTVFSADAGDKAPQFCVILCHGYGAPGVDLVPLASELTAMCGDRADSVLYVFPQAPLDLTEYGLPGGRAWWMIDINRFQRAMERPEELVRLSRETPPGMPESSRLLQELVADVQRRTGIPAGRTLLGGFSQGSMVSTDVALRLPEPPAGLCIFSGTLLAQDEWKKLAQQRGSMKVLQSHGRFDPILPFAGAEKLRDLFLEARFEVEFLPFSGPHTIPFKALEHLGLLMQRLLAEG